MQRNRLRLTRLVSFSLVGNLTSTDNQTNSIFELEVTNAENKTVTWTVDLKKSGTVYKGKALPKADVTIILSDEILVDLADGKVKTNSAIWVQL